MARCSHPFSALTFSEEYRSWGRHMIRQDPRIDLGLFVYHSNGDSDDATGRIRVSCGICGYDRCFSSSKTLPTLWKDLLERIIDLNDGEFLDHRGKNIALERSKRIKLRI